MSQKDGASCPGCGLPNYEGLCPVCRGDEQGYRDELQWAFGPWFPDTEDAQASDSEKSKS